LPEKQGIIYISIEKGERLMGKVKAWIMDLEDQFIDKCEKIAKESDSYMEYCALAVQYDDMVKHLDEQEVADIISDVWSELYSKYVA